MYQRREDVQNFVLIDQTVPEIWWFFGVSKSRSPTIWICCVHVWTTREEYLVVFITVQNLAGIDSVLLIMCKF